MKLIATQQLHCVSAGFADDCVFATEEWKEHYHRGNGYVMGAVGAFVTAALAQSMQDVFISIGAGIIGGTLGYLFGYSLSAFYHTDLPNNTWECFG